LTPSKKKSSQQEIQPVVLQNGIFVAGHPRSGTSLACQILESAGVQFPSDLGADEYNKEGYFELSEAKELEKKLIEEAMTDGNIQELNKIIRKLNAPKSLTGLKIVHIPSIFFYRHISKKMRVVFIFRNPGDVKSSMLRRGISQFKLNWFENNNALVAAHENIPKSIVISYESLIRANPKVIKAFKKLGFNVNLNVTKRNYQTQKNSRIIIPREEKILYSLLKDLEKESFK
jgi:hypothetical protein